MRHDRITEEVRETAALYVLGSLTQHEALSFELHIKDGCAVCQSELRRFRRAAAGIGIAAEEIAAPDYMRDLLSARIEREPQSFPSSVGRPQPEKTAETAVRMPVRLPAAPSFPLPESRKERGLLPWILVILLLAAGGFAYYQLRITKERNAQLEARVSAAAADVLSSRNELDGSKQASAKLGTILDFAGKPGSRVARLAVQPSSPETLPISSAALIWDAEKGQCLVVGKFPPAPEGKKYQLWFFSPTAKTSVGVLDINGTGPTYVTVAVPQEAANATWAVVTLEPDNGSQIPTSPFFAKGAFN